MRNPLPLSAAATLSALLSLIATPSQANSLGDAVLDEINFARTRPQEYARDLREQAMDSRERGFSSFDYEDPDALYEAIDFLQRQRPLPPLRRDSRLTAAASSHASAQGPRGQVGHRGPTGSSLGQRLQRSGVFAGMSAENISYGYDAPRDVVRQLIVDSGVPGRGHRKNIFGAGYQLAGAACARHSVYGAMCVINFAGAVVER